MKYKSLGQNWFQQKCVHRYRAQSPDMGTAWDFSRSTCTVMEIMQEAIMATNPPTGDGHRTGAVKKRSQLKTEIMGEARYTKRDDETGEFLAQKKDAGKFKGVRK